MLCLQNKRKSPQAAEQHKTKKPKTHDEVKVDEKEPLPTSTSTSVMVAVNVGQSHFLWMDELIVHKVAVQYVQGFARAVVQRNEAILTRELSRTTVSSDWLELIDKMRATHQAHKDRLLLSTLQQKSSPVAVSVGAADKDGVNRSDSSTQRVFVDDAHSACGRRLANVQSQDVLF